MAVIQDLVRAIFFFFFNDTATTEIYPLSLHDALPIFPHVCDQVAPNPRAYALQFRRSDGLGLSPPLHMQDQVEAGHPDRKSTRLNSSHLVISYAVFCLKKKQSTTCAGPISRQRAHDRV